MAYTFKRLTRGGSSTEGSITIQDVTNLPTQNIDENILYRTSEDNFLGWFGTYIPNNEYIEKIYFNTELSIEEVINLVTKEDIKYDVNKYTILKTENHDVYIENNEGIISIKNTDTIYFHNNLEKEVELGFVGWNPSINLKDGLEVKEDATKTYTSTEGKTLFYGSKNGLITELCSLSKIEKGTSKDSNLYYMKDGVWYNLSVNIEEELYNLWEILLANELNEAYPKPSLEDLLKLKQDTLKAGAGVTITEDNVISVKPGLSFSVVDSLPSTGDSTYIYLVPNNSGKYRNIYYEYVWVDNKRFEMIGSTEVDLSGYYKKTEINNNFYTKAEIEQLIASSSGIDLSDYYMKLEVDAKIASLNSSLDTKQNILTAGIGIKIENGVISLDLEDAEEGLY